MQTEAMRKTKNKYQKKLYIIHLKFFPKDRELQERVEYMVRRGYTKTEYIRSLIKKDLESIDK